MENLLEKIWTSIRLARKWYDAMHLPQEKRFVYIFNPSTGGISTERSMIREIGTLWDIGVLASALHDEKLESILEQDAQQYLNTVRPLEGKDGLYLDLPHEGSNIADNAFLLLALAQVPKLREKYRSVIVGLADGLVAQQRQDGSFQISFRRSGRQRDDLGEQSLYPGEALLALMSAYDVTGDQRYVACVEKSLPFYQNFSRTEAEDGDPSSFVFFVNWQAQAMSKLIQRTTSNEVRARAKQFLIEIQNVLVDSNWYEELQADESSASTVAVACALEGLASTCSVLDRRIPQDASLLARYEPLLRILVDFLLKVQNHNGRSRGFGGFPHGLRHVSQRIDITGHVMCGLLKCVELYQNRGAARPATAPSLVA